MSRIQTQTKNVLGAMGAHLVALHGAFIQIDPNQQSHQDQLKVLLEHLGVVGTKLVAGDLTVLGIVETAEEPKQPRERKSTNAEEPDLAFYTLREDPDPKAPVVVDVKGKIIALVTDGTSLAQVLLAAQKAGLGEPGAFKPFPGHRTNFTEGVSAVFTLQDYLAKYGAKMVKRTLEAYRGLEWAPVDGVSYGPVPDIDRTVNLGATDAQKERAQRRAELDSGRPYTEEALKEMTKADRMTVASLCGLDPRKLSDAQMIEGIMQADKDLKRAPTESEIAEGLADMDLAGLMSIAKDEAYEPSPLEVADAEKLRAGLKVHLTTKYVPNPTEQLSF